MKKNQPHKDLVFYMVLTAIFAALDYVVTSFVAIPLPLASGTGYLNLSDLFVFVLAGLTDPWTAGLVGGIAGLAADFTAGYPFFAPFTLLIKLIEGLCSGYLFKLFRSKKDSISKKVLFADALVAFIIGGLVMGALYMIPDYVTYTLSPSSVPGGSYMFIFIDLLFNCIQGVVNAVLAAFTYLGLAQIKGLNQRHSLNKNAYQEIEVKGKTVPDQAEEDDKKGENA
jgi:uncharacterized membrane protein